MKEPFTGATLDAPIWGVGGLAILGVKVEWWIAGLALLYGVARLTYVTVEFYWKWKDRNNHDRKQEDSSAQRDGGATCPPCAEPVRKRGVSAKGNPSRVQPGRDTKKPRA